MAKVDTHLTLGCNSYLNVLYIYLISFRNICMWESISFWHKPLFLPVRWQLSCLLTLQEFVERKEEEQIKNLPTIPCFGGFLRGMVGQCLSFIHEASYLVLRGNQEFLPHVTELETCGFRLLTLFEDYSRSFLF